MEDDRRIIITGIVIVLIAAGAGWWYFSNLKPTEQVQPTLSQSGAVSATGTAATSTTTSTASNSKYVKKTAAKPPVTLATSTKAVSKIVLSYSGLTNVSWKVTGYSKGGFYLVWSQTIHPAYPAGKGGQFRYYSDPATNWGSIITNSKKGIFYVRVCENLGTICGAYSNEISFSL